MREKYIINKKVVRNFEDEIGFAIESDYKILLYDKNNNAIIGEIDNPFGGCLWLDSNPEYDISLFHVEIFLQKFIEHEDDEIWYTRKRHISELSIVEESESKWKNRIGYVYFN